MLQKSLGRTHLSSSPASWCRWRNLYSCNFSKIIWSESLQQCFNGKLYNIETYRNTYFLQTENKSTASYFRISSRNTLLIFAFSKMLINFKTYPYQWMHNEQSWIWSLLQQLTKERTANLFLSHILKPHTLPLFEHMHEVGGTGIRCSHEFQLLSCGEN